MKSKTKKRLIALGVVLALGAGGVLGLRQLRASQRQGLVTEARARGMQAYESGDWQGAMDSLGYYVSKGGRRDAEALFRLADARRRVPLPDGSHITDSISLLRDVLAIEGDNAEARELLLESYTAASMWPEAIDVLDRLLEDRPGDRDLMERRVYLLGALGRDEDASRAAAALVEAFPRDPWAHRLRILVIGQSSVNPPSDLRAYLQVLEATLGDGIDALVVRGEVLGEIGDLDAALDALALAAGVADPTPSQIADLVDLADSLSRARPTEVGERGAALLARLEAPSSEEVVGIAIGRAFRQGRDPRIEVLLGDRLDEPSSLSDATLGWAVIAGRGLAAERRAALRAELESRSTPEGEFFARAAEAVEALEQVAPSALEAAVAASRATSELPARMHHARALSLYLAGWAQSRASGPGAGDEALNQASYYPGWWVARRDFVVQLIRRGEFQTALGVIGGDAGFRNTGVAGLLAAEARIGLAERWPGDPESGAYAAAVLRQLQELGVRGAEVDALLARALASSGGQGVDEAVEALASSADASVDLLTRTAGALRPREPDLAQRLLAAAAERDAGHPDVLFQRAMASAEQGKAGEGLALLRDEAARGDEDRRVRVEARVLRFLEATGDQTGASALDAARTLSGHADSLEAQLEVLGSASAWRDEELIRGAIARVRALSGESGSAWRIAEARRLLTFSPTPQRASEALSPTLEPLLRDGRSAEALLLASAAWDALGNRDQSIVQLERAIGAATDPTVVYPRLIVALSEAGRAEDAQARLRTFASIGQIGRAAGRARAALLERFAMWDEALEARDRLAESGQEEDALARAELLARVGRVDEAREAFDLIVEREDASGAALSSAAQFLGRNGDVEGGRALLERLPESMAPVDRALVEGEFLLRFVGLEEARRRVSEFAQRDPGSSGAAWVWLARAEIERGLHEQARQTVRRGLEAAPDSPALLAMQRLEGQGGRSDALLGALASLAAENPGAAWLRDTTDAVTAFAQGTIQAPQFADRLERIATQNPTASRVWATLAQVRLALGQDDAAALAATQGMRLSPGDPLAARLASEVFESQGRIDQALSAARAWRDRSPGNPMPADVAIARLHLRAGRPADASAVLVPWTEQLLTSPAPEPVHAATLAWSVAVGGASEARERVLAKAGEGGVWSAACVGVGEMIADPSAARAWLARVEEEATLSEDGRIGLASAWLSIHDRTGEPGDAERALSALEGGTWSPEQRGPVARFRGQALAGLGRWPEAIEAYRAAIAVDADDRAASSALAEVLLGAGRVGEALDVARGLAQGVMGDAGATSAQVTAASDLLARCQVATGDPQGAARTLDAGLARAARDATLLGRKAEVLLLAGDQSGASSALDLIRPEDQPVTIMLVLAARLGEHPQQVEWLYRRALERDSDNIMAQNNLAYHLLTHRAGDSAAASEAMDLAQRAADDALARDPSWSGLASVFETFGMACLAAGEPAKAEEAFAQGLRWSPAGPDLLLGLAEAQERQGQRDRARQTLERIGESGRARLSDQQQVRYERLATVLDR